MGEEGQSAPSPEQIATRLACIQYVRKHDREVTRYHLPNPYSRFSLKSQKGGAQDVTRLFTSEHEKDLMALLEVLQGFLTVLARDLAVSLFAMVHRFAEMTDAFTNMGIFTILFRPILVALTHFPLITHILFHSSYF